MARTSRWTTSISPWSLFTRRNGGSIAARRAEAVHFADIVSFFQAANGEEEDLIIGGDFNLPGNDPAFTAVGWNGVTYSVDHEQATSISDTGLRNSFDNLFYQEQFLTEVRVSWGLGLYARKPCGSALASL